MLHYGAPHSFLSKADAPITTATSGYFNSVYGALAWAQLNMEANAFGVLPKYVYDRSGFRIITERGALTAHDNITTLGGTPESGKIADAIKPTVEEITVRPKIVQLAFSASTVHEWIVNNTKDDTYGGMSAMRTFQSVHHKENLNKMILADAEKPATGATAAYAGSTDWESLDRIISSDAEEDAFGHNTHGDWYDPWDQIDRDSSTKYDSVVRSASGTLGTNGVLTKSDIIRFCRDLQKASGKYPNVFLTGHEVYSEIQEIFEPQTRYPMGEVGVKVDVNGVETFQGQGVGLLVSSLYGMPIIQTKDAPRNSDDAGEVGRLLALDTSDLDGFGYPRLGIRIAVPTTYNESTRNTQAWPFALGSYVEKGVYWTMGEVVCTRFNGQGKLRDIRV